MNKAKEFIEDNLISGVDETEFALSILGKHLHYKFKHDEICELKLITFANHIRDSIDESYIITQNESYRSIKAVYDEDIKDPSIKIITWESDWIDYDEELPIFNKDFDIENKNTAFENLLRLASEFKFDNEHTGMVYIAYRNIFIAIWARTLYDDTKQFRVDCKRWIKKPKESD